MDTVTALFSRTRNALNAAGAQVKLFKIVLRVIHMVKTIIVRGVDEDVYKALRERAIKNEIKMGVIINAAIKEWLRTEEKTKTNTKLLLKIKPFNWGKGTEKLSTDLDEALY